MPPTQVHSDLRRILKRSSERKLTQLLNQDKDCSTAALQDRSTKLPQHRMTATLQHHRNFPQTLDRKYGGV